MSEELIINNNNNENPTSINNISISNNYNEELNKFKEEILKIVEEKDKKFYSKIELISNELSSQSLKHQNQIEKISTQYESIINSQASINTRLDHFNSYDSFVGKVNDNLTSHEIRINNLRNEFTKSCQKYDQIYIDNLILPGWIGECCKYKTCKNFFDDVITQLGKLNSFKEKNILDLKSYKEKLETIIKNFNLIVENNNKANMKYSKEIGENTEKNCKDMINNLNDRIIELRCENSKYAQNLIQKTNEVKCEWENMQKIKEEIYNEFNNKINNFRTLTNNTINSFKDFRNDFGDIKRKFYDLSEFIKDIRFRKNLGETIRKKEYVNMAKNISNKRKESYDDNDINRIKIDSIENICYKEFKKDNHNNHNNIHHSQSLEFEKIQNTNKINNNNKNNNNKNNKRNNNLHIKKISITDSENEFSSNNENSININKDNSNNNLININNNNRYIGDIDMSSKDQIIQELANELEQSVSKLDKINEEIENNKNEINNNFNNNNNNNNNNYDYNNNNNIGKKKSNYLNIFDLRKDQREIEKKINNLDKKLNDLDKFTKQKLIELLNQIDLLNHSPINQTFNLVKQNLYHTTYNSNGNKNNQITYDKLTMNNPPSIIELGQNFIGNFPNNNNNIYNQNIIKNRQIIQLKGNVRKPTIRTISSKIEKNVDQVLGNYINDENKLVNSEIKFIRKSERRSTIDANQNVINNNNNNNINKNEFNINEGNNRKNMSLNKILNRPVTHN